MKLKVGQECFLQTYLFLWQRRKGCWFWHNYLYNSIFDVKLLDLCPCWPIFVKVMTWYMNDPTMLLSIIPSSCPHICISCKVCATIPQTKTNMRTHLPEHTAVRCFSCTYLHQREDYQQHINHDTLNLTSTTTVV